MQEHALLVLEPTHEDEVLIIGVDLGQQLVLVVRLQCLLVTLNEPERLW